MALKRIRIELFPNLDYRKFHVTAQVSSERLHGGLLGSSRMDPFRVLSLGEQDVMFSDDTKQLVLDFYGIDGIESVGLNSKTVEIYREPAYDWNEFEDEVIEMIKKIVGWSTEDDDIQIEYLYASKTYQEEPFEFIELDQQKQERRVKMFGF